jgi:3-phenylpropionate/trans-cinnamate dioxygenase ferredoxin reductase subunit
MVKSIVVVGANLAGGRSVEALRQAGFDGRITLIGDEPWRPYERPPLSKEVLWEPGKLAQKIFLQSENWYQANRVDLRLGARAVELDLAAGGVRLSDGELITAEKFLLATGARARQLTLSGADAPNVHHLRTKDEADALAKGLYPGARIVVIGMGVIGSEVAASAHKIGCEVFAVEPAQAAMIRAIGNRFGHWLAEKHRIKGIHVMFGVSPLALRQQGGKVRAVELSNGKSIDCDAVVVGIGIVPATELAAGAGLMVDNGIVVDRSSRTSHMNVFAAGDVANQPGFFGGLVRLETYQNAADQAAAAAQAMLGQKVDYFKPAWFWSDQYDLNIQGVGRLDDSLSIVVRGDLKSDDFSAFFLNGDVVEGVLTVNRAFEMGIGKRLVERRISVNPAALADPMTDLRGFLKIKSAAA